MTKINLVLVGFLAVAASAFAFGCGDGNTGDTTGSAASSSSGEAGAGGMSGSSSSGMAGAGGTGGDSPVAKYCAEVMANCKDANAQYADQKSCVGAAAAFTAGMPADQAGDTLACRQYHAGAAKGAPAMHCAHAGPSGGGVCGMTCDGFCDIAVATCKTEWPDKTACMTACATMKSTGMPYNSTAAAMTPGDNIECRLYHLSVAATDANAAKTHCAHTALISPVCK